MTPCAQCGQVHTGCTGHKKNEPGAGGPCRRPCKPGEVCMSHGGRAPQVKAARARREAEAEAARQVATLGLPIDVSPTEALLQEVQWTAGHVHWLRQKVAELTDQVTGFTAPEGSEDEAEFFSHHPNHSRHGLVWGTTRITDKGSGPAPGLDTVESSAPSVWYELYVRERAHLVLVCSAALKAGVEERRVRLAESQGDLVATAIRRILDALGLTEAQQALVGTVVPRELRLIAGGTA
jgi:hypothetical protein